MAVSFTSVLFQAMDPFVGEIRIMPYGGNFITKGWAQCNGQLLPISQNAALYSLLGVQYGGDGRSTFALPNLSGRAIVGAGSTYQQGSVLGTETVALAGPQLPAHTHTLGGAVPATSAGGSASAAAGSVFAADGTNTPYGTTANNGNTTQVMSGMSGPAGSGQPHDNHMPYLALGYFIALVGIFPTRP